ncbi:energy-coupling factor transporter transmembrane component T family protein [Melissococcus plutonius]|uniref:energy-coupling factor transporter transmembrane component T family protein n=1 Tax=Melissococcus plutonius TaxID=33970 RepID=UPI00065E65EC|nr:energy-coupling factor transporter transmembrane protein EcfT [Melissococcus plutonius]AIM25483.1 energy-coupling factor transporter transmembrane protein EcfT [Melissococcus plutonius S1]KMT25802.1 energy-coupling factor transporter transmembrane protein EcfT [Melissococcus plutonius]KMT27147.1 energy-coupling factor transporter transmembrane protein EcfT [Melissococcus plutonius]KMT28248.1 energy-coupling factor transporter transmembrane protein EcfT [Melissococcus plutonius]KMT29985.1 en
MTNKLIFGRYIPGNSFIHTLDPRTKLIASFYYILIIFLANNWQTYLLLAVFTFLAILLSKINLAFFVRGIRPLLWLILFTVSLQILFTRGGTTYWEWGIFSLTFNGIANGLLIFCRFVLIIFMSTLLTLTTSPLALADAIEYLLRPLKVIRFPVHEVSLMLSIALRFVPTLMDETEKIMNAQRARGVDFGEGSLIQKMKAVIPLLIPLFVSSFNRAEDLATAMEARGYQGGEGRTRYRILYWHKNDLVVLLFFVLLTVGLFILRS